MIVERLDFGKTCGFVNRFHDLFSCAFKQHSVLAELQSHHGWFILFRRNINDWEIDDFFAFDELEVQKHLGLLVIMA